MAINLEQWQLVKSEPNQLEVVMKHSDQANSSSGNSKDSNKVKKRGHEGLIRNMAVKSWG